MEILEVLKQCTVEGNVVSLPDVKLDREEYLQVAKQLNLIGGKWKGGKTKGFVFDGDPTELLAEIAGEKKRDLKKEYQFFETPEELAKQLVDLADIKYWHYVLEPSAGRGAIVREILKRNQDVSAILRPKIIASGHELMDINRKFLKDIPGFLLLDEPDFLKSDLNYDRIIANPPFSKNQDIDHIRHMYRCLRYDGVLVSVASNHWRTSDNKKETEFRQWLSEKKAEIFEIPSGTFKESGTMISACIIRIREDHR
jgi:type I restriction-modification system DNA methylase subunit